MGNPSSFGNASSCFGIQPIMIDLDGDGVEIFTRDDNCITFDVDDDGFAERTSWVGADDGFLMFDENDDGAISSAREIILSRWLEDGVDLSELYTTDQVATFDTDWTVRRCLLFTHD